MERRRPITRRTLLRILLGMLPGGASAWPNALGSPPRMTASLSSCSGLVRTGGAKSRPTSLAGLASNAAKGVSPVAHSTASYPPSTRTSQPGAAPHHHHRW